MSAVVSFSEYIFHALLCRSIVLSSLFVTPSLQATPTVLICDLWWTASSLSLMLLRQKTETRKELDLKWFCQRELN